MLQLQLPVVATPRDLAAQCERVCGLVGKARRSMPSMDTQDPGYRRLRYVRYADDTLLGFAGPKAEAEEIKQRLAR